MFQEMTTKQFAEVYIRATMDLACYTGATWALLAYGYPTIAAALGSFGVIYMYKVAKAIRRIHLENALSKQIIAAIEEELRNAPVNSINTEEDFDKLYKHLEQFNDNDDE